MASGSQRSKARAEIYTVSVINRIPSRTELLCKILEPEYKVSTYRNFLDARGGMRLDPTTSVFITWEPLCLEGAEKLGELSMLEGKLIVIVENQAEKAEAFAFFESAFPLAKIEILYAPGGYLTVGEVLGALDMPFEPSPIASSGAEPAECDNVERPFDVFLSVKNEDYDAVQKLFWFLVSCGLKVFFARKSVDQIGNAAYSDEIERALDEAKHMVVVTSNAEYLHSSYVRYEWRSFHNEIVSGRKSGNLLVLTIGDVPLEKLPYRLRQQQVLPLKEETFEDLLPYFWRSKGR